MDHIDEHLATAATSDKYSPAIQAALAIGKRTLNRYYNMTDHSELYRIAIRMSLLVFLLSILIFLVVLHPRHKLQYFQKAHWKPEWVAAAEQILRDEFDRTYRFREEPTTPDVPMVSRHLFPERKSR
jgi:hypothetical protein